MSAGRNLTAAWAAVTAEDIEFGAILYPTYRKRIAELAGIYGFPVSAACGAFAALSPRAKIVANFRSLRTCMIAVREGAGAADIRVSTYDKGKFAALAILRGEADFADICKGPKITAFRHNLLFPDTSPRVTIDGHMIGIMAGKSLSMDAALLHDRKRYGGSDEARYQRLEKQFLRWWSREPNARRLLPLTVQAILWHAKRRHDRGELVLGHGVPEIDEIN